MNIRFKSIPAWSMVSAIIFFAACGSKKEEAHDHSQQPSADSVVASIPATPGPQFVVDSIFQKQLSQVFVAYVSMKNAFVSSEVDKAKASAVTTQTQLSDVDMKLLDGAAHKDWMIYLSAMETSLKEIQSAENLEASRKSFSVLTDNLYKSIKSFGLNGETVYYDFCPMAFENEGGFWLSEIKDIRNPYFGDKMLTCGSVQETLN